VFRARTQDYFELGSVGFQSLRDDEETDTIPFVLPELTYWWDRPMPGPVPGLLGVQVSGLGILRSSQENTGRIGGGVDWRSTWILPRGVLATATAAAELDFYKTWNIPGFSESIQSRGVPIVSTEFRWPLMRSTGGASHLIEPIVQVAYSKVLGQEDVPNEDSQLPELDEGNLFSLDRFPGRDRVETGLRANVGVQYTRFDPAGWTMDVTFGQVIRAEPDDSFAEGTGLAGRWSDYVGAVTMDLGTGLLLSNRALFNGLQFRRNEFAVAFDGDLTDFEAAYTYLAADDSNPILGPQPETNAFGLAASYRFHPNWEVRGNWRYDATTRSNIRAGGGITYGNECAEFDLSVSRRFTSSDNLPPATSIAFGVRLAGLGEGGDRVWPSRVCTVQGI
jgi:LPS-assembly protein